MDSKAKLADTGEVELPTGEAVQDLFKLVETLKEKEKDLMGDYNDGKKLRQRDAALVGHLMDFRKQLGLADNNRSGGRIWRLDKFRMGQIMRKVILSYDQFSFREDGQARARTFTKDTLERLAAKKDCPRHQPEHQLHA